MSAETSRRLESPRISILVIEYGTAGLLDDCLAALAALERPAGDVEVIVVDNASPTPVDKCRRRHPEVRWLGARRNLGFAGGCMLGLTRARAPIVASVNPDCRVDPGWASAVLRAFETPDVGVVGSKISSPGGATLTHAGGRLFPSGRSEHFGDGEWDLGQHDTPRDVPYVTGAAFAVRRAVIEQVGYLSPAYFPAYYEETELCVRAAAAGWRVRYAPDARAVHRRASASAGADTDVFLRRYHEGRLRFVLRNFEGAARLRFVRAELAWRARMSPAERRIAARAWLTAMRTFGDEHTHAPTEADVSYEGAPAAVCALPSGAPAHRYVGEPLR